MRVTRGLAAALMLCGVLTGTSLDAAAAGHAPTGSGTGGVGRHGEADRQDFIVLLDDAVRAEAWAERAENRYGAVVDDVYHAAVSGYSASMTAADARALAARPQVVSVRRDRTVHIAGQQVPTGVRRSRAFGARAGAVAPTAVDADVAVIDTGVDLDHPDLNVYRAGARNCASWSYGADDQHGHGTHVAGTVGALNNAVGVVGVAPGARIWPVRVLGADGSGSLSDVICGVDYVTANADRIEVANMSLGMRGGRDDGKCGYAHGDALHQAVCASVAAGVTYVVAAGNSGQDAALSSPAGYPEVITVSALADFNGRAGGGAAATCRPDVDDTFADFSNYGSAVDIIAPGVCILSTWLGGRYSTLSGTSMASPHVAGAAARYLATHPNAAPATVRSALRAAGSPGWSAADDPDRTQEPLLDASGL